LRSKRGRPSRKSRKIFSSLTSASHVKECFISVHNACISFLMERGKRYDLIIRDDWWAASMSASASCTVMGFHLSGRFVATVRLPSSVSLQIVSLNPARCSFDFL
jgi:hypothetical protein